jgi:hypothetical protein
MKYFTPELYLEFNSPNDTVADRADAEWESAIRQYNLYLKDHRSKMPASVRMLAEKCCFHDAVLLGRQTHEQGNGRLANLRRLLTLGLQQGQEMIVLYYTLGASPKESKRRKNWPFSQEHKHWLYDEIAVTKETATPHVEFVHRILWSDGSELEIPFVDVIVDRFPAMNMSGVS